MEQQIPLVKKYPRFFSGLRWILVFVTLGIIAKCVYALQQGTEEDEEVLQFSAVNSGG